MNTLCSGLASAMLSSSPAFSETALVVTLDVIASIEDSIVGSAGSSLDAPTLAARSDRISWWILKSRLHAGYFVGTF